MDDSQLTEEQKSLLFKIEKFDEIIEQYKNLKSYRNCLASTIISNLENMYMASNPDKKHDPESIRSIESELKNIDTVISFIDSIVFEQQTKRESSEFTTTNEPNN